MPDPISVASFSLQAFSTLRQVAKSFNELKTEAQIAGKVAELNSAILDAQGTAMDLQQALAAERENVQRLRDELRGYSDWAATLDKYELVDAGVGKRLWRRKEGDAYYICPNCVTDRIESILQTAGSQCELQWCPKCDRKYQTKVRQPQRPIRYSTGGDWP